MSYINFESSKVKELEREERKRAREIILANEEAKYIGRKATKEKEKWMLDSVEKRIKSESSKEKKRKHKKKRKKAKKRKSSSSGSSDDSDEDDEWVEKVTEKESDEQQVKQGGSLVERDEWMTLTGMFPCVRRDKRDSREQADKQNNKYMLDRLGQTDRELNPYWKDGGTGLPEEKDTRNQPTLSEKAVGDYGVDWLRRALKRAKEQAVEEGRSLEAVAAERWGSLKNLETMISEAEKKSRREFGSQHERRRDKGDTERYKRSEEGRSSKSYEKRDERSYSSSRNNSSNRSFQKPRDEHDVQSAFQKPRDSEMSLSSYRNIGASGNWRKKSSTEVKKIQETHKNISSSSDSETEENKPKEQIPSAVLSDKEMNELGAKLVKAEILGNEELANELRSKLEAARTARTLKPAVAAEEEVVVLTRTDSKGLVRPLQQAETSGGSHKKQKVETHRDGSRVRYFADDDKYSLQDLFEHEKLNSVEDQNEMFIKLAGKAAQGDMDDIFEEKVRVKESSSKVHEREKGRAIREHKMVDRVLSNCKWCFDSKEMLKHLIVAIGSKVYLCLPPHQSLTEGHCLIVPMFHTPCATQLDEDVWNEVQTFKKILVKIVQGQR
ncbi:hypothetical protein L9F63_009475 [Diploptera punctata]|uniref:Cwf19-like C-terminal domain-containing protein n=1 Tax=Diploptera punctata TaxID=6984 RepID=A0AAD8AJB7_DIPPU|nr:hypothetical protein L9F63_009475 [Diploptera punctata]